MLSLHRHRVALQALGVTRLVPRVLALGLPATFQKVWVEWQAEGAEVPLVSQVAYAVDCSGGWRRVVAMVYSRLMVPEFSQPAWSRRLLRSRG